MQMREKSSLVKKVLPLIIPVLFFFASCKKEITNLPDETQTGAGTFGAKINGENWGPLKAGILPTAPILESHYGADQSIFINAQNFSHTPIETEMEIYVKHLTGPGTYSLNQTTEAYPNESASYAYYVKRNLNVEDEWITSASATGQVVVTRYDSASRIVSGTFQFTAAAHYGSAPVTVTEGRFDVQLQ